MLAVLEYEDSARLPRVLHRSQRPRLEEVLSLVRSFERGIWCAFYPFEHYLERESVFWRD